MLRYIAPAAAALFPLAAMAQGLNQTVSVTRVYEGKLLNAHKPLQSMPVPDSLTHFDLDFDYSVFENEYAGAYDFKPYSLEMRPQAEPYSGKKLYLRAGAGYRLRPSVDFVWEPLAHERFRMSVYGSHHSYFGDYRNIGIDGNMKLTDTGGKWNGYDMYTNAGVNGQADMKNAMLAFDVNYLGIHTRDNNPAAGFNTSMGYNAANVNLRMKSENPAETYLYYDMAGNYRYSVQGFGNHIIETSGEAADALVMNDLDLDFTVGPVLNRHNRIVADFGMGMTWYEGIDGSYTGNCHIVPKYVLNKGKWDLSIGVRLSAKMNSEDDFLGHELNTNKGIILYPDVHIGYRVREDHINLYFTAKGGENRNPYVALKERNHFFTPLFNGQMTNNTVTQYDLALGFGGNVKSRFRYDMRIGYASYESAPLDCVLYGSGGQSSLAGAGVAYRDCTSFYSDIMLQWESRDISVDSRLRLDAADFDAAADEYMYVFAPAFLQGHVKATYNWKRRIYAGMSAEFSTRRDGIAGDGDMFIPAWVDLGIHAEYVFSRKMSFWVRGENLLGMNVQRIPLYTGGGAGFTAGICINL